MRKKNRGDVSSEDERDSVIATLRITATALGIVKDVMVVIAGQVNELDQMIEAINDKLAIFEQDDV